MDKDLNNHNYHGIDSTIIADNVNTHGHRITSFVCTFPRIVLAEFNTHRMLCLAGDTQLSFDLPSGMKDSDFKIHKMSIEEFYGKWVKGARKRKRHSYKVSLEQDTIYNAKEISSIIGKGVSSIRTKCRDNTITTQNPDKNRSEDFLIKGSDYNEYHNGHESKGQNITGRLENMKIRQLDEDTGLISHSTVKNCIYSDIKEVYTLSLENGDTLNCSRDHRILTEQGWKTLKEVSLDDYIITQQFGTVDKVDKYEHKKINGRWISQFVREHKHIIIERQDNICAYCDSQIEEVHHLIPVYEDHSLAFDLDNMVGICKDCHKEQHKEQDWQTSKYLYGKGIKVSSIEYKGKEKTYDLEIEGDFPNFLANNIIVHNSRNSASSRAIPFKKMLKQIKKNPFVPIKWLADHKGMQGEETIPDSAKHLAIEQWLEARDLAVDQAERLNYDYNVTKQFVNRLLEPFKWHTVIVTATEWENFFALRAHEAAEIHIQDLAYKMLSSYIASKPTQLKAGKWHIPFGDNISNDKILEIRQYSEIEETAIKIATARCARVSYENFKGGDNYQKDIDLHDRLVKMGHWSPMEHCAKAMNEDEYLTSIRGKLGSYSHVKGEGFIRLLPSLDEDIYGWSGNFKGFTQYRKMFEQENKSDLRVHE